MRKFHRESCYSPQIPASIFSCLSGKMYYNACCVQEGFRQEADSRGVRDQGRNASWNAFCAKDGVNDAARSAIKNGDILYSLMLHNPACLYCLSHPGSSPIAAAKPDEGKERPHPECFRIQSARFRENQSRAVSRLAIRWD